MFDTNVWILLFGPVAGAELKKQKQYSSLLREISSRGASIYITSLIVSEYINTVLRLGFKQWKREDKIGRINADFKQDYRNTEHYKSTLEEAVAQINVILSCTIRRPDDFHRININSMLDKLNCNCDYNDAYIVKCCEQDHLTLVSNDHDFAAVDSGITLLTTWNSY